MKILIVGAGAVGQVYGWHLRKAGHAVSFFVKPKYQAAVSAGLDLYRLSFTRTQHQPWSAVSVISQVAEVRQTDWDQVWLTLPSDALRGELATELLRAVGAATVVCLQPDLEDCAYVQAYVPASAQVVQGMITFISFQSPLPGASGPDGIAYFVPPLAPALFAGEARRVAGVVAALKAGGLMAAVVPDFAARAAGAPALMQPIIAALEVHEWQLSTFTRSPHLRLGLQAAGEALMVAHRQSNANVNVLQRLLSPLFWRLALPVIRCLLPFDLEAMLHYHYAKVGVQSRMMLDTYIRLGHTQGVQTSALQRLRLDMDMSHDTQPLTVA
jgi:2-dehydropantoate 2-reductase